jgi:sugar phosphate isomerase/epimerase
MHISQVAVQLYTVREHLQTASDMAASFRKVKEIGYDSVELAGVGSISDDEVATMLADAGLTCVSSHDNPGTILDRPEAVVERLGKYRCSRTGYPAPAGVRLETLDDVKALAARLNTAGEVLSEAGVTLSYHNHSMEFRRFDGHLMLDVLYEETDPRYVQGQLDTYWVQYGGGDSEDWCRRLKGRMPSLHLKDYAMAAEHRPTFAEVGHGNLNWEPVILAAGQSGCEWYIVEQDRCERDPFESIRMSFEYIRDSLCS